MKITGYNIRKYTWHMDRALGDANSPSGSGTWQAGSFLSIETDEGIAGVSLGGNNYVASLFPILEGEDPRGNIGLWKKMMDHVFKGGNEGEAVAAISAIDIALWDLKAKIADQPLWKLLGASEPRTKAYASGIDLNLTDDEIYTFYSRMADQGIDGGKLKVGLDMEADLRRIGIMNGIYTKYASAFDELEFSFLKLIPVNIEKGEVPLWIEVLCPERGKLMDFLASRGIQTRPFLPDLNLSPHLGNDGEFPRSRVFSEQGVFLPCGPDQPLANIDRVIEGLQEFGTIR